MLTIDGKLRDSRRRGESGFVDEVLYETGLVTIGLFRADVGHPGFGDSGPTERPIFVFPRTSVVIRHEGGRPFTTDTCTVTYYNRGQRYTREPVDPSGDRCEWFSVRRDVLVQALTPLDPAVAERPRRPFRFGYGPSDASSYALQRTIVRHVLQDPPPDALAVEEAVVHVMNRVIRLAYGRPAGEPPVPKELAGNPADAAGLAESVRRFLIPRIGDDLRLDDLAGAVGCSVFYLCRIFREQTGTTVHRYRNQLRLRRSLELVAEPDSDLSEVGFHLGFSSHSHFTAAFRAIFGTTPSDFRAAASSRRVRELAGRCTATAT